MSGLPKQISPLRPNERLAVLDVQRGLAILAILFLNIPAMGNSAYYHFGNPMLDGWSGPDRVTWALLQTFVEGTQRGLLEFLFGASALLFLQRSMPLEGSLLTAEVYLRRNLWLALFGLADIFLIGWFGDILLPYALAGLLLFFFRRLRSRTLLAFIAIFLVAVLAAGYWPLLRHNAPCVSKAAARNVAVQQQNVPLPLVPCAAADRTSRALFQAPPGLLAQERQARLGSYHAYRGWLVNLWFRAQWGPGMFASLADILVSMFLGMVLFRFGIILGLRTSSFYGRLMLGCYLPGLSLRAFEGWHILALQTEPLMFKPTEPLTRLLVSLGHLALINWLFTFAASRRLLQCLQPAGRNALTLYLTQNFIGLWILFPAVGFGLWGHYGWFGLTCIGIVILCVQAALCDLWGRYFRFGPLEWLWRSLTYATIQRITLDDRHPEPQVNTVSPL